VTALLTWLESTSLAVYIAESTVAFPAIEIVHVVAIALVFGTIAIVDFRLLGLGSNNRAVTELCRDVLPWTWAAFAVAAFTGTLLFITQAMNYIENPAFRMKMLLMFAAAINMVVFEFITFRGVAKWDRDVPVAPAGKLAGAVSLVCWLGVVGFARWVGFTVGVPE
jgi:cbb3-type cytochrome oxidase subunit 1